MKSHQTKDDHYICMQMNEVSLNLFFIYEMNWEG